MSKFHFLNVTKGDCHILQHNSNRVTMIDICNGNTDRVQKSEQSNFACASSGIRGNFGMCQKPTHPLSYLDSIGISEIWRFILSHPDMDHMDGLDALFANKSVLHYWDSGLRREKPDFGDNGPFKEEDWDRYESIIAGKDSAHAIKVQAGDKFAFANKPTGEHDGLHILSPNQEHLDDVGDNINDGSYVILYHSPAGKILIPGDAHDKTWEYVLENYSETIKDCAILVAPHHGRGSDGNFDFLKTVNPKLVLLGCASSKDLAYDKYRDYTSITNNQAGNVVAESTNTGFKIYVENKTFAEAAEVDTSITNSQGYYYLGTI